MAQRVAGEQYESITGQLFELGRQLRQPNGYPFDSAQLKKHLQDAIEGRFQVSTSGKTVEEGWFGSAKYFVSNNNLWVSPDFAQRILPVYVDEIPKRGLKGVDFVDLPSNMCDREIIAEYLGGEEEAHKNAFTPDQIADLIDAQLDGKSGKLLNNGRANIFYVVGKNGVLFVVYVCWPSVRRFWGVNACKLDSIRWFAYRRIFHNKR